MFKAIKKRRNRRFCKDTVVDFFFGISSKREFDITLHQGAAIISGILVWNFGWGWLTWLLLDAAIFGIFTFVLAGLDTYNAYKYRVRQNMIASVISILRSDDGRR